MTKHKYIHLLLIFMLCFGQFAASMHIAGHVHHHSADEFSAASIDSSTQTTQARVVKLQRSFAHLAQVSNIAKAAISNSGETVESLDCSVYHVFSSLYGALASPCSVVTGWSVLSAVHVPSNKHAASSSTTNQRIRAPPHFS